MKHFSIRPDGDYRFRNKPEGEIVTIQVEYDKGGYSHTPRGIYVTGRFSEIGDGFERFTIGGGRKGFRLLIEPVLRKNAKRLDLFASKLDEHAPALADALDTGGPEAARTLAKQLLGVPVPVAQ
jgi:hypothetical protein